MKRDRRERRRLDRNVQVQRRLKKTRTVGLKFGPSLGFRPIFSNQKMGLSLGLDISKAVFFLFIVRR